MTQCESAVVYEGLPISSGGAHGLGRMSVPDAYAAWVDFLESCCAEPSVRASFMFTHPPELEVEPRVRKRILQAFPGPPERPNVPMDRISSALELIQSLDPQPRNPWGMEPVWLWVDANFKLRAPSGGVLPDQSPARFGGFSPYYGFTLGTSDARLGLRERSGFGLNLSLPNVSDEELSVYIPWLQGHLPFKISTKHWSRWSLTKNGRTYRCRKILL